MIAFYVLSVPLVLLLLAIAAWALLVGTAPAENSVDEPAIRLTSQGKELRAAEKWLWTTLPE